MDCQPPPGLGILLPFPRSFWHLQRLIAEAFHLQAGAGMRLFVDEGGEDEGERRAAAAPPLGSSRRGGELLAPAFCLLRDSDCVLVQLVPAASCPQAPAAGAADGGAGRVELTIVEAVSPSLSSPPSAPQARSSLRFAIAADRPLSRLLAKYAQCRRWEPQSVRLTLRRRRTGEAGWDERELTGSDTCSSSGITHRDTLYATQRAR